MSSVRVPYSLPNLIRVSFNASVSIPIFWIDFQSSFAKNPLDRACDTCGSTIDSWEAFAPAWAAALAKPFTDMVDSSNVIPVVVNLPMADVISPKLYIVLSA